MKTTKGLCRRLLQLTVLVLLTTGASAQLHADFSATPVTGCPPIVVSFKDNSTGNPLAWKWDLGNGTVSFLQNPVATYFTPGSYNIKLTLTNAGGIDSIVKSQYVVVNALPAAKFGASDSTGCFPLKINFTDSSLSGSGTLSKWQWDFGDGTLSALQNPSHTYTSAGTFTVILRVSNSNGCAAVITKPAYVTISNGVKADFTFSSVPGCTSPTPVMFTNGSAGTGLLTYQWNFGDGKTSTLANPVNNYNAGVYTVRLIAANSFGCTDTMIKTDAVNIGFIHADFSSPDSVCAGSSLHLTNTSTPANYTGAYWNFGDGSSSNTASPDKIFTTPGTYRVKLVAALGSCNDSIVKPITVLAVPTVAFTASNTRGCANPLTVSFQNGSANGVSYLWSFGDGTTSALQNPTHAYTSFGSYSVSLTVTNAFGCSATLVKDNLVKLAPVKILSITGLGVKGCLPVTVSPVAAIEDSLTIATYLWNFGDGATSAAAKPTHTYTTPGLYDVTLTVTTPEGCTDTYVFKDAVKAGNKPVTSFSANPTDVCASSPVTFTDLSTNGPADQWLWFFGDGGISAKQNPVYTYNDTGYFNVTLITSNFGCSDTLKIKNYVHIRPPVAKFDTSFLCNDPLKRNFIDKSIGANTWSWDFGDGSTSAVQNPSHTYAVPGSYPVILTVSNGQCEHTAKKNVIVIKENGTLAISESESCINTRIIYNVKNINPDNIATYNWYFDSIPGAVTVTGNNPVAWVFSTPGTRYSAVILKDILNCPDTLYAAVPVKSYGAKASFAGINPNTCFGNTVTFTDSTKTDGIHPITEYLWDYGENTVQSYSAAPFSHDYTALGTYNVKLVVTDSYGCKDSITRPLYVSITKPVVSFTASDTALCPSAPITFTNASTGVNATYTWNFGDGTTSNDVSPVHSFTTAGSYTVTLDMVDKNGCTATGSLTINVYSAKADFAMSDSFKTCPPLVVGITNKSVNYISLNWDFGDGGNSQLTNPSHIYTYPGNYTVKLLVRNNGGCIDSLTKNVVIKGPTGTFDYTPNEACNPGKLDYKITAQNTVNYIWDFNDGTTVSSVVPTISHTYINSGIYLPKVILQDGDGCQVPLKGLDTVRIHSIKTNILSNTKLLCDSGIVVFSDSTSSDDVINDYLWKFGDGTTSTSKNPSHNFTGTGFYSVSLIANTRFGCKDTAVISNYIKIVNSPLIKMLGDTSACEPARLQLSAGFVRTDTSAVTWQWDFGNGSFSTTQIPDSQTYVNSGSYQVTVKATNSDGCTSAVTRTAVIHPKPAVDAGPNTTICRFNTATLNATGADSYTWTSHPTLSCTSCATPVAKPDSLVTYHVTGTTLFGCTNEDSVTIKVQQPFKMVVSKTDTLCKGESVTLKATGTDNYQWSPSLWLDNATGSTVKARPDTSITYQVTGSDSAGCFKDVQSVKIKVYPVPTIDILNGSNVIVQVGGNIKLNTKSSADVSSWKWFPGQWLSCASCADPVAAPMDNITYKVTATNEGKCTAQDQITINLICNNANVFMPNTFSPNGDGVNDVFYPRGKGLFDILTFKVFNRWGQVVFQKNGISANNIQDGWDGNLNGAPLQPDVYVYLIEVVCSNNIVFPFKGNVTLIR